MTTPTASDIQKLMRSDLYSPQLIPDLESYLVSQVEDCPYDFDANRRLIKLYQFFPQKVNREYLVLAGLLSLVYGQVAEFGAINCLIPESFKTEEPFPSVVRAVESRDACLFESLWGIFNSICGGESIEKIIKSRHAKNFLRKSILATISLTFKNTKVEQVLVHLDMDSDSQLKSFVKDYDVDNIESIEDGVITFRDNIENTKRNKISQEGGVDFTMIKGVMTSQNVPVNE